MGRGEMTEEEREERRDDRRGEERTEKVCSDDGVDMTADAKE